MSRKDKKRQSEIARSNQGSIKRSVDTLRHVSEHFSGPIPPPHILEKYEAILPGAAERILAMAEKNSAHQIEIDKAIVDGKLKELSTGQKLGFYIAILALCAAVVCSIYGDSETARIMGGSTIVGLVVAFLTVRLFK